MIHTVLPVFGFSGILKLPRVNPKRISLNIERKSRDIYEGHHWEIGWKDYCSEKAVLGVIAKHFFHVENYVLPENRRHQFFICSHNN
jgi:hypothetical protein